MSERSGKWLGAAGFLLHVLAAFPYAMTGLVAPPWGVALLWSIWLALLGVAVALWRTRPAAVLVVPVAAIVVWFGVLAIGDVALRWTA